ncbi:hypothetical protein IAR55_005518 [Kwoniella newhampshirensis]|uniref:Uncharacterized protein n=1 Tax=Kwoniella newhampshirensis TaxID=1651941 RepID=A0AAW0YMF9_9TREE
MSKRPTFVDDLVNRPLPALTPARLSDENNTPYKKEWQDSIADLKCHPALESALHLMNDDLFSAHFLLRKMQEDEWAKWLHAILHQTEGDLEKNAKLWYQQVDPAILRHYWTGDDACGEAIENMYRIMSVKAGKADEAEETKARQIKWDELCCVMSELEKQHNWRVVDGTEFYTRDEDPSHKSMVLGECRVYMEMVLMPRRGISHVGQIWRFRSVVLLVSYSVWTTASRF